jgi:hypothetical protein
MAHAPARSEDRPLDERGTRHDVCPDCGGQREELLIAADLFYCPACAKSSFGPNEQPPAVPEPDPQAALFEPLAEADEPPPDEGMAWVGEEGPDE